MSKTYDKLFFKAKVSPPILQNIDGKKFSYHIIDGASIEIIIPQDAKRLVDGVYITRSEFKEQVSECSFCSDIIEFEDKLVKFVKTDVGVVAVCPTCINNKVTEILV